MLDEIAILQGNLDETYLKFSIFREKFKNNPLKADVQRLKVAEREMKIHLSQIEDLENRLKQA